MADQRKAVSRILRIQAAGRDASDPAQLPVWGSYLNTRLSSNADLIQARDCEPIMQSLLQYRRFKRHLDQQTHEYGIHRVANLSHDFPPNVVLKSADNAASLRRPEDAIADPNTEDTEPKLEAGTSEKDPLIVDFESPFDPFNPQTWTKTRKWIYTFLIAATGFIISGAAAFDTAVTPQAAAYFGVSQEIELLSTTLYMVALGLGSLVSAPFSETVGRNPVYIICELMMFVKRDPSANVE